MVLHCPLHRIQTLQRCTECPSSAPFRSLETLTIPPQAPKCALGFLSDLLFLAFLPLHWRFTLPGMSLRAPVLSETVTRLLGFSSSFFLPPSLPGPLRPRSRVRCHSSPRPGSCAPLCRRTYRPEMQRWACTSVPVPESQLLDDDRELFPLSIPGTGTEHARSEGPPRRQDPRTGEGL